TEARSDEARRLANLGVQIGSQARYYEVAACGDVLFIIEEYDAARTAIDQGIAFARDLGAGPNLAFAPGGLAMLELRLGRLRPAYVAAMEAVRIPAETGQRLWSWSWAKPTLATLEGIVAP